MNATPDLPGLLAEAERDAHALRIRLHAAAARAAHDRLTDLATWLTQEAQQATCIWHALRGARWLAAEPAAAAAPQPESVRVPLDERPPASADSTPERIRSGYCHRCTASTLHLSPLLALCPSCLAHEQERERRDAPAVPFEFTGTCAVCGELVADGRRVHRECEQTAGARHG